MKNKKIYEENENKSWTAIQNHQFQNFKITKHSLNLNIGIYILIFIIEYFLAIKSHAQVLRADAFNNLSDIISSLLLMIGIHIAGDQDEKRFIGFPVQNPKRLGNQKRIRMSRFRFETIFILVSSILIIEIAIKIIIKGIKRLFNISYAIIPNPIGIWGALISVIMISILYLVNHYYGKKSHNSTLLTSAQDCLGDIATSLGTALSIFIVWKSHITWIDSLTSILIGSFVSISGLKIFLQSSLNLVDYFNPQKENQYKEVLLQNKQVQSVPELVAHYNGDLITVEAEVVVNSNMTIEDSFLVSEQIEKQLNKRYGISDTKIIFYPNNP